MILAAYRLEPIGSVEVCLWYMLGVVLYAGVRLLTWVRTPAVDRIPLGQCLAAKGQAIKEQVREAFYQDADDWKDMVWERAVETQRLALAGLAGG